MRVQQDLGAHHRASGRDQQDVARWVEWDRGVPWLDEEPCSPRHAPAAGGALPGGHSRNLVITSTSIYSLRYTRLCTLTRAVGLTSGSRRGGRGAFKPPAWLSIGQCCVFGSRHLEPMWADTAKLGEES